MVNKFKPKMTKEQRAKAVSIYLESEMSLEEIAKNFDCTKQALWKAVKKYLTEQEQKAI